MNLDTVVCSRSGSLADRDSGDSSRRLGCRLSLCFFFSLHFFHFTVFSIFHFFVFFIFMPEDRQTVVHNKPPQPDTTTTIILPGWERHTGGPLSKPTHSTPAWYAREAGLLTQQHSTDAQMSPTLQHFMFFFFFFLVFFTFFRFFIFHFFHFFHLFQFVSLVKKQCDKAIGTIDVCRRAKHVSPALWIR